MHTPRCLFFNLCKPHHHTNTDAGIHRSFCQGTETALFRVGCPTRDEQTPSQCHQWDSSLCPNQTVRARLHCGLAAGGPCQWHREALEGAHSSSNSAQLRPGRSERSPDVHGQHGRAPYPSWNSKCSGSAILLDE